MSNVHRRGSKGGRRSNRHHISVRAVRREQPDLRKLSRALIALAMEQAATEAAAQQEGTGTEDNADD
ncbi:hypothetical protein E9529_04560 [Blastococcus sp. KM273128]|uniref:hypothetical protein n=1 Tax=Blastococcus sp. KM273128 TaxID=2570314 RepID=UPI001F1E6C86|nr:hypothetical protein [Blastococcus sp. KM273128]MCF6743555.1 hypothetical protein [Blastococcus sp. KM273128]